MSVVRRRRRGRINGKFLRRTLLRGRVLELILLKMQRGALLVCLVAVIACGNAQCTREEGRIRLGTCFAPLAPDCINNLIPVVSVECCQRFPTIVPCTRRALAICPIQSLIDRYDAIRSQVVFECARLGVDIADQV